MGDGTSVGTGISVGERGISELIEKKAEDIAADCTGTSGTVLVGACSRVSVSVWPMVCASLMAGEVGEGLSVGTGSSLGDLASSARGGILGGTSIGRVGSVSGAPIV